MGQNPKSQQLCSVSLFKIFLICVLNFAVAETYGGRNFLEESFFLEGNRDYKNAIQSMLSLQESLSKKEDHFFLNLRLGWLYYLDKKYKNAEDYYQKALMNESKSITAHLGLSNVLAAMGREEEAISLLDKISSRYPSDYSLNLALANLYTLKGKRKEELVVLNRLLTAYPEDVELLNRKGDILISQNQFTKAQELLKKVLLIRPQNVQTMTKLNYIQEKLNPSAGRSSL